MLRVGAHHFTVVQPARRDLLQVLQVKDVVPAGRARSWPCPRVAQSSRRDEENTYQRK